MSDKLRSAARSPRVRGGRLTAKLVKTPEAGPDEPSSTFPPQLAAGLTVAAAALGVLGLTGDALLRAARNDAGRLGAAAIDVLIGAAILAAVGLIPWPKQLLFRIVRAGVLSYALFATTTATIGLVQAGADSLLTKNREAPFVALAADQPDPVTAPTPTPMTTLELTVKASSVASRQQLDVHIIGLANFTHVDQPSVDICETRRAFAGSLRRQRPAAPENEPSPETAIDESAATDDELFAQYGFDPVRPSEGAVLLWSRIGPKADGTIDATYTVDVPTGTYQGACAFVDFALERGARAVDNSVAYVRLESPNRKAQ